MKKVSISILLSMVLLLAGCKPAPTLDTSHTESSPTETAIPAVLSFTTTIGDFEIAEARLVEEINNTTAQPGAKILILVLRQPGGGRLDPASFSLEAFNQAIHDLSEGQTHITGDDGSDTISTMAGWTEQGQGDFVIGFQVPEAATKFTFYWPGNEPIELFISE